MGTNEGWPEAFGFSIIGGAPVMINDVEEGGSAQQAGLQIGDFIVELEEEPVDTWSGEEVVQLARQAHKVPPSLVVVSRVRKFSLPRSGEGGFGVTFRGNRPVFIRSVDFNSDAHTAGLRSGDLIMQLNGKNVRYSTKIEVLELLKATKDVLRLTVVAGGLAPAHQSGTTKTRERGRGRGKSKQKRVSQQRLELRYEKARVFHSKMDYYLMGDSIKKTHLLTLLRLYSKDRDINSLGSSLSILLDSPIERRLFSDIRTFIHPSHHHRFDVLLSYYPQRPLSSSDSNLVSNANWRGSLQWTRPIGTGGWMSPMRASMPDLSHPTGRVVKVKRGHCDFGFSLSGNAPVFIRSVDKGGAAERAGLKPGDQLLQLNGINIRGVTHSQVVRLLRLSGTQPTFVVSSLSSPAVSPLHRAGMGVGPPGTSDAMTVNIRAFKDKIKDVLVEDERQGVMKQLSKFSKHKEISELVNSLTWVLDSPAKMVLFHYICQLLPDEAQSEFDRIAAAVLAGEPAVHLSSGGTPFEGQVVGRGGALRLSSSSSESSYGQTAGGVAYGGAGEVGGTWERGVAHGGAREVGGPRERDVAAVVGAGTPEDVPVKITRPAGMQEMIKAHVKEKEAVVQMSSQLAMGLTPPPRHETSVMSTPGGVPLPPNPPPTPTAGVGGVPIPPPPPPALPGVMQSHLKRVNWEKIHGTEGTIWKELSGLEETLEYFEIEEKFASQNPKEIARAKKDAQPAVLEERKAYNLSILLGHLKLPFDKIKEEILACDDSILSEQHLRQMEAFAPDKKECLGFARYHDNPSVLGLADRFSCEMSTLPGYQQRLRAMIFKLHFKGKIEEIKPDLEAISEASRQLQTSKNFKRVLEIVLAVGNYMNAGNQRVGGAIGFRIKFLTQLKHLKTTDNKSTLLHFVAGTVERKFPQVLQFAKDLSFTTAAARVSGETLEVEVNELMKGVQDIQRDIEEISSAKERIPGDRFQEVMTEFVLQADEEMTGLLKTYAHMKQEYASALKFFGEDSSTMRIDDFFSAFAAFITDFERAVKENCETREKLALLERRNQEKEQATKRRGSFKFFSRSSKNLEKEIKKEFEAKTRAKKIDIKSLEESHKVRAKQSSDIQQKDFRHLLRRTDQPREKKGLKSEEKQRSKNEKDEQKQYPRIGDKKKGRYTSTQATELTGSWDYIPSEPSSTVDLIINQEDNHGDNKRPPPITSKQHTPTHDSMEFEEQYMRSQQEPPDFYHSEEEDSDDMAASPPVLNLPATSNFSDEMDWEVDWDRSGPDWNKPSQDFDYETQF